ncbi:MAG: shikimate kinase [Candidatus Dormibacteria bacterium]
MTGRPPSGPGHRVVVMGMMAAGKSRTGRSLATRLGWDFWDNDDQLVAATGHDARSLTEHDGVEVTHKLELKVLQRGLAARRPSVVCAPGSAVLTAAGRGLLTPEWVVWLRARPETLAARVARDPKPRPLLGGNPLQAIRSLDAERRDGYAAVSDLILDVDALDPEQAADRILGARARLMSGRPR